MSEESNDEILKTLEYNYTKYYEVVENLKQENELP